MDRHDVGVSFIDKAEYREYDHHCPLIPGELNCYKASCLEKQQLPEHRRTCYPICHKDRGIKLAQKQPQKKKNRPKWKDGYALLRKGYSRDTVAKKLNVDTGTVNRWKREIFGKSGSGTWERK